jgi:hypothetical protein
MTMTDLEKQELEEWRSLALSLLKVCEDLIHEIFRANQEKQPNENRIQQAIDAMTNFVRSSPGRLRASTRPEIQARQMAENAVWASAAAVQRLKEAQIKTVDYRPKLKAATAQLARALTAWWEVKKRIAAGDFKVAPQEESN